MHNKKSYMALRSLIIICNILTDLTIKIFHQFYFLSLHLNLSNLIITLIVIVFLTLQLHVLKKYVLSIILKKTAFCVCPMYPLKKVIK